MDVTIDYKLFQIKKHTNKNHFRVRQFVKDINKEISGYRLLAFNKRGTYLSAWCNREANLLEKRLTFALKGLNEFS